MKFLQLFVVMATLLVLAACENDIKQAPVDSLLTDELAVGDTDNNGSDNPVVTDGDTPVITDPDMPADDDTGSNDDIAIDDALPDDTVDDTVSDNDSIPQNDCAFQGGVCVSDPECPGGYTASEQFTCDTAICCMATGVTGLRIDVTGPQPIPGSLLSIPAIMPTPTQGGTGTPEITSDIGPTALIAIELIEDNPLGCNAYQTTVTGSIVLVKRGTCQFSQKITNAANAGAIAIIVYNNTQGALEMQADGTIPAVGITQAAGEAIIAFTQEHPDITAAIRP